MTVNERIKMLREKMAENSIDIYIIPSDDFHQSEYVGDYFKAREYITGFDGSAGTAVITKDTAKLWTDGRYFIQAAAQLKDTCVELMKIGVAGVPTVKKYIEDTLCDGMTLGFDGRVVSAATGKSLADIAKRKGASIDFSKDLINEIWTDRPPLSTKPVFALDIKYTGESAADKLIRIRAEMKKHGAVYHLVSSLDDICWTLNIRGDDIDYFPLVLCYALISENDVRLYVDENKFDSGIKASLAADGVRFMPYNGIYKDIAELADGDTLLLDAERVNYALYNSIPDGVAKTEKENPEVLFKARKNAVEIENIRKAEIKDSVAHIRFMKWLKENIGKIRMTEMSVSEKLDEFRRQMGGYIRPSFDALCAYGANAAIVHYSTSPEHDCELKAGNVLLTDTGAGYYEGSTDITRTYALGEIPRVIKEHFTLTAISNLELANAKFLKGCAGPALDILARRPFWDRGLDFNHGTGHGVGYLMNIHEDPYSIYYGSKALMDYPFEAGVVFTDEPGIYIESSHGIRLENNLLVCEGEKNSYGQFMYFEMLSYIPFDLDAILPEMMDEREKRLLNGYHRDIYEKVSPYLDDEEKGWLKIYTREI